MSYNPDKLDRKILDRLQKNARYPFQLLAKELDVSGGTIHIRYNKMVEAGLIEGSKIAVNRDKMGFDVCAYVGINLHNARDYKPVLEELRRIPEILEAHYTTGKYNIFIKAIATSTRGLQMFLTERLQEIPYIQSTETLICLDTPINRDIPVVDKDEKPE